MRACLHNSFSRCHYKPAGQDRVVMFTVFTSFTSSVPFKWLMEILCKSIYLNLSAQIILALGIHYYYYYF